MSWARAVVRATCPESAGAVRLVLEVDGWSGHLAGQHVDLRLTAEDGYTAWRSYSIASRPEEALVSLVVQRVDAGEVSPYLISDVQEGDVLELRGPVGGHFVWRAALGGPVQLIAGGSGSCRSCRCWSTTAVRQRRRGPPAVRAAEPAGRARCRRAGAGRPAVR
jgi:ferredoxin-NADP reductase